MACQHRGCNCADAPVTRDDKTFCDDRCAQMETSGRHEKTCPCGHRGCKAKSGPTPPSQSKSR